MSSSISFVFLHGKNTKVPSIDKRICVAVLIAFVFKGIYLGSEFIGHLKNSPLYFGMLKNNNNHMVKLYGMRKPDFGSLCIKIDIHMCLHFQY